MEGPCHRQMLSKIDPAEISLVKSHCHPPRLEGLSGTVVAIIMQKMEHILIVQILR